MKLRNVLLLASLGAAFAGCGLFGPSYNKPNTQNPDEFQSRDVLAVNESANLPMMAWWEKFDDHQLNYLIESALANNNNIQAAVGNVVAAQGFLRQIQFAWIPTAGISAGYNERSLIAQGYNFQATPSYSLNIFQQIRSQEYAKANYEAVLAAKDTVRLSVISATTAGYFTLLGQDYQLQLQKQLVEDLKGLYNFGKLQYEEGLISLYQLQSYEQDYENANAQVPIIENNIVASQNALRVLLNQNPGDIKRGVKFNELNSYGVIPINLPSQVLRNRPDVRQAEQQLIAANANIGIATSSFFPSINLTGLGGSASDALSNLFSAGTDYWVDAASVSMPFLNFGIYGQIQQAKGQYYAAYYNYLQTVRSAFASVDNDLSAHQQLTVSLKTQTKAYDSSVRAYKFAETSFHDGLYSKPQLLQNAVVMDKAALVLQQSKLQQLGTIVQLYQDLGGGYGYKNNESTIKFGDGHDWD
ncbi:MAG: efflux transporter outer membrane subunit [Neisseriaceae bacterium]|nr:MAG: efflux transporter outer membrane subunit [Neisseriaceae bacterium]